MRRLSSGRSRSTTTSRQCTLTGKARSSRSMRRHVEIDEGHVLRSPPVCRTRPCPLPVVTHDHRVHPLYRESNS